MLDEEIDDVRPVDVTHLQAMLYSMRFTVHLLVQERHRSLSSAAQAGHGRVPSRSANTSSSYHADQNSTGNAMDDSSWSHFGAPPSAVPGGLGGSGGGGGGGGGGGAGGGGGGAGAGAGGAGGAGAAGRPLLSASSARTRASARFGLGGIALGRVLDSFGSALDHQMEFRRVLEFGGTSLLATLMAAGVSSAVAGPPPRSASPSSSSSSSSSSSRPHRMAAAMGDLLAGLWTLFAADCARLVALARRVCSDTTAAAAVTADSADFVFSAPAPGDTAEWCASGLPTLLREAGRQYRFGPYLQHPGGQPTTSTTTGTDSSSVAAAVARAVLHAHTRAAFYLFLLALVRHNDPRRGVARGSVGSALCVSTVHANPIQLLVEACNVNPESPLDHACMPMLTAIMQSIHLHA